MGERRNVNLWWQPARFSSILISPFTFLTPNLLGEAYDPLHTLFQ